MMLPTDTQVFVTASVILGVFPILAGMLSRSARIADLTLLLGAVFMTAVATGALIGVKVWDIQ